MEFMKLVSMVSNKYKGKEKIYVGFNKIKDELGWMSNMSDYGVDYNGKGWKRSEYLFMSLRFDDEKIIDEIRSVNNVMMMKRKVKSNRLKEMMIIEMMGDDDVNNMKLVIGLKFNKYKWMRDELLKLKNVVIFENVENRKKGSGVFWGGYVEGGNKINDNIWIGGELKGKNVLGDIIMEYRNSINI